MKLNLRKFVQFVCEKLLDKDSKRRLGSPSSPYGEITQNVFFQEIDWRKLERKQLASPYKPEIVCNNNTNNKTKFIFIYIIKK